MESQVMGSDNMLTKEYSIVRNHQFIAEESTEPRYGDAETKSITEEGLTQQRSWVQSFKCYPEVIEESNRDYGTQDLESKCNSGINQVSSGSSVNSDEDKTLSMMKEERAFHSKASLAIGQDMSMIQPIWTQHQASD